MGFPFWFRYDQVSDTVACVKLGSGNRLQIVYRQRRQFSTQNEMLVDNIDDSKVGINSGNTVDTGKRKRAAFNQLRFAVREGGMTNFRWHDLMHTWASWQV